MTSKHNLGLMIFIGGLAITTWSLAQTAFQADGIVESTSGGFKFPDGTVQATAATGGVAPLADTGQKLCKDPSGTTFDTVDCTGTGQDGETQIGVDWPAPRFNNNLDGTITDNLTGLIWLRDANCTSFLAPLNFESALEKANGLSAGFCGLTDGSVAGDWRLPNVKELLSLVDYGQTVPSLPLGHPFGDVSGAYWSSTYVANQTNSTWTLGFTFGLSSQTTKTALRSVWTVRGGQ